MTSEIAATSIISRLPHEHLEKIFSQLNQSDLQAAVLASRVMRANVVAAASFNEPASIIYFIQLLIGKLNIKISSAQMASLQEILKNITTQGRFPNLLSLKGYILEIKPKLIDVIKTLDEETIERLGVIQPPRFMEDIFKLAALEKSFDDAMKIENKNMKDQAFARVSKDFSRAGNIDRAIKVAMLISLESTKGFALAAIVNGLIEARNFDKALDVAINFVNEGNRKYPLFNISKGLKEARNFDRAIEVANMIPDDKIKAEALAEISKALREAGNIDRADEVDQMIPDDES